MYFSECNNRGPLLRYEHLESGSFTFNDEERYIFRLVSQLNVNELANFLRRSPPINITRLLDNSGYTTLHLAVYKNSFKMALLLCDYVKYMTF